VGHLNQRQPRRHSDAGGGGADHLRSPAALSCGWSLVREGPATARQAGAARGALCRRGSGRGTAGASTADAPGRRPPLVEGDRVTIEVRRPEPTSLFYISLTMRSVNDIEDNGSKAEHASDEGNP